MTTMTPTMTKVMTKTMTSRNVKRIEVSPELFPQLFIAGAHLVVENGLPPDTKFRGYTIDPYRNCLSIFIEHPSFPSVHEGQEAPQLEPPILVRTVRDEDISS